MTKKNEFYKKLNHYRRLTQLTSFAFIIIIPIIILYGFREIIGNYYSFTIFGLEIIDPSVALQTILLSHQFYIPMLVGILIPIIFAFIFGRVFCSWVCPYTALFDFLEFVKSKLFKKKISKIQGTNPKAYWYWSIFGLILLLTIILSFPIISYMSAPGIISSNINFLIIGASLSLEFYLIGIILIVEVFSSKRIWCKYVCPVGSVLSIFRSPKTMKISYTDNECDCKGTISPCRISCPLNLDPKSESLYPYCYNCGKCIKVCEKTGNGALKFTFKNNK